ncbi:MAG: cell division protein ZapD [Legionellaceae bacterium]|nr:cell division protein ZapD [Legionellaceae bacterium]
MTQVTTQDTICFQLGTQYLSKIALQIERLLLTIDEACHEQHPVIHHSALNHVFEIIKLAEKPELKGRFLKEFMRLEHLNNKALPHELSGVSFTQLLAHIPVLSQLTGRFGEAIHADPFIQSVGLTSTGHINDIELCSPQLWFWLEDSAKTRQDDLTRWLEQLRPLYDTVKLYLALLREACHFERIIPEKGFYQCSLPYSNKTACHLVMIRMNKQEALIPKVQIGNHGLSLRLCEAKSMREVYDRTAPIELAMCKL